MSFHLDVKMGERLGWEQAILSEKVSKSGEINLAFFSLINVNFNQRNDLVRNIKKNV